MQLNGQDLREYMQQILDEHIAQNKTDEASLRAILKNINDQLVGQKEQELYELIAKADEAVRAVKAKRDEIRSTIITSFETAESVVAESNLADKQRYVGLLNSAIIRETRLYDMLFETAQNAFITAIEDGINVGDTCEQIAKELAFSAISEGEFQSERILTIAKTIINASTDLANTSLAYTEGLIEGAATGVREGMLKSIERLKSHAEFAPNADEIEQNIAELKDIDEKFIKLLKQLQDECAEPSKSVIAHLLNTTLDTGIARLKRLSEQAAASLTAELNAIKQSPLAKSASERFERLKSDLSDTNLSEKFSEFEKSAKEKFDELKASELTVEAKKLGERAFNAAKNFIDNLKNKS